MSPVLLSLIVILSRLTAPQCLYSLWDQSKSLVSTWRGHQTTYHQFLSVLLSRQMENLETDLVRGEERRCKKTSQDLQSIRASLVNTANKMKNSIKTLATLYPNNFV